MQDARCAEQVLRCETLLYREMVTQIASQCPWSLNHNCIDPADHGDQLNNSYETASFRDCVPFATSSSAALQSAEYFKAVVECVGAAVLVPPKFREGNSMMLADRLHDATYPHRLFPDTRVHDLSSDRVAELVCKGFTEPRSITIAEIYELCASVAASIDPSLNLADVASDDVRN